MKRLGPSVRVRRGAQGGSGSEAELGHHLETFGGVGESGGEGIVAGGVGGGGELGFGPGAGFCFGLHWRLSHFGWHQGGWGMEEGPYFAFFAYSALGVSFLST